MRHHAAKPAHPGKPNAFEDQERIARLLDTIRRELAYVPRQTADDRRLKHGRAAAARTAARKARLELDGSGRRSRRES
jgi:hypothetical protein